ncbi:profilin-1-like [Genypterus blacodes]|uniref:profilin-1-like n=1 Tax=Genypterus blacodes TaxID=154954 RepID=UPI003F772195
MANAWEPFLATLTAPGDCNVKEAAIYGLEGGLWVSTPGLASITAAQIQLLTSKNPGDQESMFTNGVILGDHRCTLVRNELDLNGLLVISTKGKPSYSIGITLSEKALVMVMGKEGQKAGGLLTRSKETTDHLRRSKY